MEDMSSMVTQEERAHRRDLAISAVLRYVQLNPQISWSTKSEAIEGLQSIAEVSALLNAGRLGSTSLQPHTGGTLFSLLERCLPVLCKEPTTSWKVFFEEGLELCRIESLTSYGIDIQHGMVGSRPRSKRLQADFDQETAADHSYGRSGSESNTQSMEHITQLQETELPLSGKSKQHKAKRTYREVALNGTREPAAGMPQTRTHGAPVARAGIRPLPPALAELQSDVPGPDIKRRRINASQSVTPLARNAGVLVGVSDMRPELGMSDADIREGLEGIRFDIIRAAALIAGTGEFVPLAEPESQLCALYGQTLRPRNWVGRHNEVVEAINLGAVDMLSSLIAAWLTTHVLQAPTPWQYKFEDVVQPGSLWWSVNAILAEHHIPLCDVLSVAHVRQLRDTAFQEGRLSEEVARLVDLLSVTVRPHVHALRPMALRPPAGTLSSPRWRSEFERAVRSGLLLRGRMDNIPKVQYEWTWYVGGTAFDAREMELLSLAPEGTKLEEVAITVMPGLKIDRGVDGANVARKALVLGQPRSELE